MQKLGETVEAVRAAGSQSVVEHDARWRAEVAAREALAIEAQAGFQRLEQFIAAIRGELRQEISTQVAEEAKHRQWLADHFGSEFQKGSQLEERFKEVERSAIQLRTDLAYLDWRVGEFVEEARKRLPKPFTARQIENVVTEQDEHKLDALYAHFEDVFRGTRPDIKSRQSVYLPMLKEAKAGTKKTPVLDVGCGRGEWLELLHESGLEARGVDTNRVMVKQCQDLGLNANLAQALVYLRSLPAVSLGAVTGFHIIEHMPFASLIDLLDETVRVLKPGGLAIFETPNPQNILVGSREFYNDPTHLKPVPSHVFRFLAEARGLCKVEVLNLHPYPEAYLLRLDENGVAQRINEQFYGPQDYSIIGRKA